MWYGCVPHMRSGAANALATARIRKVRRVLNCILDGWMKGGAGAGAAAGSGEAAGAGNGRAFIHGAVLGELTIQSTPSSSTFPYRKLATKRVTLLFHQPSQRSSAVRQARCSPSSPPQAQLVFVRSLWLGMYGVCAADGFTRKDAEVSKQCGNGYHFYPDREYVSVT
jgi:hypothetical protein